MKVLITGGAGFIGGNLGRQLAAEGIDVVAFDDLSTGRPSNLAPSVKLVEGSVLDGQAVETAMADAESVVHLAARTSVPRSLVDPVASHSVNATGTVNVLEAARRTGVGQVIVASSSSVYGANPILPKAEHLKPDPVSPYAASKLASEAYALSWSRSFDLPVLVFRFFNVFGPLQAPDHAYAAVIPAFVAAALRRQPLQIFGDGLQTRDFTYVGSLTSVLAAAIQLRLSHPSPVNLAFGSRHSLLDVVAALEAMLDRPLKVEHRDARVGDVRDTQADDSLLRSLVPPIVPVDFETGLRSTVDWLREHLAE